jgi:DNA polymerase-3 subunit chi
MTRVDFYILTAQARSNRYQFACQLAEKVYKLGRRIYINAGSADEIRHLDRLLWTFRDGSFIPHGVLKEADPALTPVLLGSGHDPDGEDDVLINLAPTPPNFFSRFDRLAEIVDQDPQILAAGRERYRFYRERGYPLNNYQITP